MKRMNVTSVLAFTLWLACWSGSVDFPAEAQKVDVLVMVVNKNNGGVSKMSRGDAKKLLLGQTTSWPDGGKVIVVLRAVGNVDRTTVLQKICGMSEAEYTRHNLQAEFMGEAVPSISQAASAAAIRNFIKANAGAVGFIHESEVDNNVKIVWPVG